MLGDDAAATTEVEEVSVDMSGFSPVSILGNRSGVLRLGGADRSRKGEDRERLKKDGRKGWLGDDDAKRSNFPPVRITMLIEARHRASLRNPNLKQSSISSCDLG
jgi:hypothetical protein